MDRLRAASSQANSSHSSTNSSSPPQSNRPLIVSQSSNSSNSSSADVSGIRDSSATSSFLSGGPSASFKSARRLPPSGLKGGASTRNVSGAGKSTKTGISGGGSGRRSKKKKKDEIARVYDDSGRDVTPIPLSALYGSGAAGAGADWIKGNLLAGQKDKDKAINSVDDFNAMDLLSGGGSDSDREGPEPGEFEHAKFDFPSEADNEKSGSGFSSLQTREWTDKELRERMTIKIEETETVTILYLPGTKVWGENEKWTASVLAENDQYRECLEKHKEKDKFTGRAAQTLNESTRDKEIQSNPPMMRGVGVGVNTYDIWDTYQELEKEREKADGYAGENRSGSGTGEDRKEEDEEEIGGARGLSSMDPGKRRAASGVHSPTAARSQSYSARNGSKSSFSSQLRIGGQIAGSTANSSIADASSSHSSSDKGGDKKDAGSQDDNDQFADEMDRFLQSDTLRFTVKAMEEALIQNEFFDEQLLFRNFSSGEYGLQNVARLSNNGGIGINGDLKERKEEKDGNGNGNGNGNAISDKDAFTSSMNVATQNFLSSLLNDKQLDSSVDLDSTPASLRYLWSFSCSLTTGRTVSCMSWNKQNTDLLAVGYGNLDFQSPLAADHLPGLICFWSLKNPYFPQKVIQTAHSVTALDFCTEHPHLLAAGLYDGSVCIYDVRDHTQSVATHDPNQMPHGTVNINGQAPHIRYDKPALESSHQSGKHSEPVWGVKWVNKESKSRTQLLMSISSDGTIKQWSIKKGLIPHELMQLKRIPNRAHFASNSTMEGISREASGMCFDFPFHDGTQYFAGTEDGIIHKCSISYNEQTLENYFSHTAPVYKLRCSPFLPDAFLSCSADWSCALWSQKSNHPILKFQSGHDYILDCVWSPANSCMFGLVARDGRIEIWDIENSPLDPYIALQTGQSLTSIVFGPQTPVVLAGTAKGEVLVYRMEGVEGNWNSPHQGLGPSSSLSLDSSSDVPSGLHTAANQRWNFEEQASRLDEVLFTHTESRNKLASVLTVIPTDN